MHRTRTGAWLLIVFCCTASLAGAATQVPEALRACVSEKADARRLSCYDREIARLEQQTQVAASAPPAAAVPVPAAAAPAPVPEEEFGLRAPVASDEADRRKAGQLQGKITSISSRPLGELVLTLDNNQVWAQKTAEPLMRLKVGDDVTIKRGAFGSFLLVSSGRSARVTRVQ